MRKIVIVNKTQWSTRDLRRFVNRACHEVLLDHEVPVVHCTFKTGRAALIGGCSGWAILHGSTMQVCVGKQVIDKIDLAFVIGHELGHLKGLNHAQMRGSCRWRRDRENKHREIYSWGDSLPLAKQVVKEHIRPSAVDKAEHCQTMIKQWKSKVKRANTALKKWERKLKYYQKKEDVA